MIKIKNERNFIIKEIYMIISVIKPAKTKIKILLILAILIKEGYIYIRNKKKSIIF
jgi:hypothetical protein